MGSVAVLAVIIWFLLRYLGERQQAKGWGQVIGRQEENPDASLNPSAVVSQDLERLEAKQPGLGAAAARYVLTGEGGTVLSTLGVVKSADVLELCVAWYSDKSPSWARRRMLGRGYPYDVDVAQRYAEVLAVSCGQAPDAAAGSAFAPLALRILMSEAILGMPERLNTWPRVVTSLEGRGLQHVLAIELARRLGGGRIDVIDIAYIRSSGYAAVDSSLYRQAINLKALLLDEPAVTLAAAKRMNAAARVELLQDLSRLGLALEPPFLEFFLEQAGDSAKASREIASATLLAAPEGLLEARAAARLAEGDVNQRAGMADLLAKLGSPVALDVLRAHREGEKTARIVAVIDTALAASQRAVAGGEQANGQGGYVAMDGHRVVIPPRRELRFARPPAVTEADRNTLLTALRAENLKTRLQNEENAKAGHRWRGQEISESMVGRLVHQLESGAKRGGDEGRWDLHHMLGWGWASAWGKAWLNSLPDEAVLSLATVIGDGMHSVLPLGHRFLIATRMADWLAGPDADLRSLEAKDVEGERMITFGGWNSRTTRKMIPGDYLREAIATGYNDVKRWSELPHGAVWPYLAENLEVFDEAFGLKATHGDALDKVKAIHMLTLLPATPERYFGVLLEMATGTTRAGRVEARAMLAAAPDVGARLIALLEDSRQAERAGAAEGLADRNDDGAVAAMKARLKKEKSELAQAALLTALTKLGEDISGFVGPKVLVADAEKGLKSAKLDKLAWLGLEALPRVTFKDGKAAPPELLKWWIALAVKLKQPGGNGLFSIYLDQLKPEDARAFSTWVLDAWISYDTATPSDADGNAYAKANAPGRFKSMITWWKDYTEERAFADLKREFMSQYLNSGADTKGLLALVRHAPSAIAAERTRSYLKKHGARTSQASALLEMLAGIGDPVALQVVISAATRLKQKSIQKFAGELITRVADTNGWTLDELADRTIPAAGFDDEGVLSLTCGEDGKVYEGRLNAKLEIVLRNPAGKEVAGLPSGTDEATAAAKKQLSTSKKELKQVVSMQTARLYEALCAERAWPADDWVRLFHDHPVMRQLVERVVWTGLNAEGKPAGAFRPTAEGDFSDAQDNPIDIATFASVRLAHGALMSAEDSKAWEQHLKDYEVQPLFVQFGRTLMKITAAQTKETQITDRKGWLTDAFIIRGAAGKLGYERGGALDGGFFNEYRKSFGSARLDAVIEFTGNSLPEENVPAAMICLKFERQAGPGRSGGEVRLGDVPPVLLSECWNDYHAFAAKGVFDAEWEKKSPW